MSRPKKLIQFYLTNLCNSHCKTCSIWKNKIQEEIPLEKVIEIINQFPEADYVFGGGEFTLYSKKHELLTYCDDNDINYTVLSNAVNISLLVDLIKEHEIKNLTISCDGIKHDIIRGVENNLSNIRYIVNTYRDKIPNIKLSYTLSKFNESCTNLDMDYIKNSLGFDKIYFCIAQDMDLLKVNEENSVEPSDDALRYFYNDFKDMLYDKDQQCLENIVKDWVIHCDSTQSVHTIYTNGDVVRCQSVLSKHVIGNINEELFIDILERDRHIYIEDVKNNDTHCPYEETCKLVCQRRYDYEDRL